MLNLPQPLAFSQTPPRPQRVGRDFRCNDGPYSTYPTYLLYIYIYIKKIIVIVSRRVTSSLYIYKGGDFGEILWVVGSPSNKPEIPAFPLHPCTRKEEGWFSGVAFLVQTYNFATPHTTGFLENFSDPLCIVEDSTTPHAIGFGEKFSQLAPLQVDIICLTC